jgi:hypothetical protein
LNIVQIVPRLGSLVDGVADHARALAAALDAREGLRTAFLSGDPEDRQANSAPVATRSAGALVEALEALAAPAVLLHYVCYGYSVRGCPFWLIRGLERWKRRNPGARLVTMFHELYAFGPPWRSSFWLSPVQRYLASEAWRISDAAVTNVERYRRRLSSWRRGPASGAVLLPVFSNVGEPSAPRAWSARAAQMVVFGREDVASRAYERRRAHLLRACEALQIERIVDVGRRTRPVLAMLAHLPVSAIGFVPPAEVSTILSQSKAGFVDYRSDVLGKSTVFAAYAAHGVVPVVPWRGGADEPGLAEGRNYWSASSGDPGRHDFAAMAGEAAAWYAGHRLEVQSAEFARKLRGP